MEASHGGHAHEPRLLDRRLRESSPSRSCRNDTDYLPFCPGSCRIEDYKALLSVKNKHIPFFGPNQRIPVVLALILGIQHALAMLGGLVVPPILLSGPAGAGLSADDQIYLVAASLVWCGLGTLLQVSRIPVGKGYFIGSGVVNVIGTSFVR